MEIMDFSLLALDSFKNLNNILLLDDDEDFVKSLASLLRIRNFSVTEFTKADQAIEEFSKNPYPICIIDYKLEEKNGNGLTLGIDVLKELKTIEPLSEIIMVTAYAELNIAIKALEEGASDFLLKPFNSEALFIAIDRAKDRLNKNLSLMYYAKKLKDEVTKRTIELEVTNKKLLQLSITDELTGLMNYRAFNEKIKKEFTRSKRFQRNLSLILFDIDHFKAYNDTYGHIEGNRLLQKIAIIFKNKVRRDIDHVFRYGGDEFVILLPESTSSDSYKVAERIKYFVEFSLEKITLSGGIASLLEHDPSDFTNFIKMADTALYKSKDIKNTLHIFSSDMMELGK